MDDDFDTRIKEAQKRYFIEQDIKPKTLAELETKAEEIMRAQFHLYQMGMSHTRKQRILKMLIKQQEEKRNGKTVDDDT